MPRNYLLSLGSALVALLVALLVSIAVVSVSSMRGAAAQEATHDEAPVTADAKQRVNSAEGKGRMDTLDSGNPGSVITSRFSFKAKNLDRVSDAADGKVSFENSNGSESQSGKGKIECLRVAKYFGGTKAGYFVFRVTESSGTDAPPVGTPIGVNILDTGKKHGKGDGLTGAPVGAPDDPTPPCQDPSASVTPLTNGNIDIRVITPVP